MSDEKAIESYWKDTMSAEQAIESFWKAVYRTFDPAKPVQDEALRAPREGGWDRHDRIGELLAKPIDRRRYCLYGAVGSGKTTELLAISRRLTEHRVVVYVDLWTHFQSAVGDPSAINRLQSWEVLGLLGLALIRAGSDRWGHQWGDEPQQLQRAIEASKPEGEPSLDVNDLARSIGVVAGGVAGALAAGPAGAAAGAKMGEHAGKAGLKILEGVSEPTTSSWNWKIGLRRHRSLTDQDQEVRDVLRATNRVIMSLQEAFGGARVALVVDGLDRARDEGTFEGLFVESSLLGDLSCDLVLSLHLALVERFSARLVWFDRKFPLANIPVVRQDDPRRKGPGVVFFRDLVRRRMKRISRPFEDDPFPDRLVDHLAWCSGGRMRDFMRMVRALAEEALPQGRTFRPEQVDLVIDEERRNMEVGLDKGQIALLKSVADDPQHELPADPAAYELVKEQRLLAYPNKSPWYLPHPLLLLHRVRLPGDGIAAFGEE